MESLVHGLCIVTYRRPVHLGRYLDAVAAQSRPPDLIVVVDNGSDEETARLAEHHPSRPAYLPLPTNTGAAGGYAAGVEWLLGNHATVLTIGDDDNPPLAEDVFGRLLGVLASADASIGGIGVVGSRWDWKTGKTVRLADDELDGCPWVDFIGTNNLPTLRRKAVEEAGGPRADLFFGYPDLEFCLRVRACGYGLLVEGDLMRAYREHYGKLGHLGRRHLRPRRSLRDIWRDYYTTRNFIYMMRCEFGCPGLAWRQVGRSAVRAGFSWGHGLRYGARYTQLIARGVYDGFQGHLGRRVEPQAKYADNSGNGAE